jgi:hypothetical protein
MRIKILLLAFLSIGVISNGQITIVSTDFGSIGDQITVATDSNVAFKLVLPSSGVPQVFDYTALNVSSIGNADFVDPATTSAGASFPNSNLAISRGIEIIYTIKSTSSIMIDGIYGDLFGTGTNEALNIFPDMLLMSFPLGYGDTYSSSMVVDTIIKDTITGFFDSLRVKSTTTITTLVDAYGVLNLPTMSDSVLRKKDIEITVDSIWGITGPVVTPLQQTSSTGYYYRFIAKNRSFYVLELEADASGVVVAADFQTGGNVISGVIQNKPVTCYSGADGSVEIASSGGVAPYSYLWSDGQTTDKATGLTQGVYTVTTTDANSDTFSMQVTVSEPDSIDVVASLINDDYGSVKGAIYINVSGGTPSYDYVWSNGETTKNIENLDFGTYTVTVTDYAGCDNTNSFVVDNVTSVKDITDADVVSVYPHPSKGMLNIETTQSWELKIWNLLGKQVFTQNGSGFSLLNIHHLKEGIYLITISIDDVVYQSKLHVIK